MILIDGWPYDLMVSGELNFENELAESALEEGSDVTDNVKQKQVEFSLEGIVSDTPIGEIAEHPSRRVDEVSEAVFGSNMTPLPSAEAYDRLLEIRGEGGSPRFVTIEIPFPSRDGKPSKRTFQNMALVKLTVPMSKDTDGGLYFSAEWRQIKIARNNKVTVRVATPSAAGNKDTKATVGHPYQVDSRILWRMGRPAGATLNPNYSWTVVNVSWSDGRGGPSAKARYHYGDEHSPDINHTSKDELSPDDLVRYTADLKRDQAEKAADRIREPQRRRDADAAAARAKQGPNKDVNNLPAGVDLSRFERPPSGPTLPNTDTANIPQGVDLNRFQTPAKPTF